MNWNIFNIFLLQTYSNSKLFFIWNFLSDIFWIYPFAFPWGFFTQISAQMWNTVRIFKSSECFGNLKKKSSMWKILKTLISHNNNTKKNYKRIVKIFHRIIRKFCSGIRNFIKILIFYGIWNLARKT